MADKILSLEEFEFPEERALFSGFIPSLIIKFLGLTPYIPLIPPVVRKESAEEIEASFLEALGEAIGFDDPLQQEQLSFHQNRLNAIRRIMIGSMQFILAFSFLLLVGVIFALYYFFPLSDERPGIIVARVLAPPVGMLLVFVSINVVSRIVYTLIARHFSETFCIVEALYLVVELNRDGVLTCYDGRKKLLQRIDFLARNTLLLFWRYGSRNDNEPSWLKKHFQSLEQYIRERGCWVIAPKTTTLNYLRQDFYRLASIYITGNYGDYIWSDEVTTPKVPPPSLTRRLLMSLPRLLGIVLPVIVLGFLLLQPELLEPIGIEAKTVGLIFIGWLLLGIDSALRLGIVEGVVNLAKGIKELA